MSTRRRRPAPMVITTVGPSLRPPRRHRVHAGHAHEDSKEARVKCQADYRREVAYARVDLLMARMALRDNPSEAAEAKVAAAQEVYDAVISKP